MNSRKRGKLEGQLSAYLDGELSAEQRVEVEAFLAEDERARALLEDLRRTSELVGALPRAKAGDELIDALRGRLERKALLDEPATPAVPRRPFHTYLSRWAAVAAVLALSLTTLYFLWSPERDGRPAHPQFTLLDEPTPPAEDVVDAADLEADDAPWPPVSERTFVVTNDVEPPALLAPPETEDQPVAITLDDHIDDPTAVEKPERVAAPETVVHYPVRKDDVVIELAYANRPSLEWAVEELTADYGFRRQVAVVPHFDAVEARSLETHAKSLRYLRPVPTASVVTLSADIPDREMLNDLMDRLEKGRRHAGDPRDIRIEETPTTDDEQRMHRGIRAFLERVTSGLAEHGLVEDPDEVNGVADEELADPASQPVVVPERTRKPPPAPTRPATRDVGETRLKRQAERISDPVANQPVDLAAPDLDPAPMAAPVTTAPTTAPAEPAHILRLYLRVPASPTRPAETPRDTPREPSYGQVAD